MLTRSQRGSQCHFFLACGGAGEQEIGDVGACDEQHHGDRGQQSEERSANVGDRMLLEWDRYDALVLIVVRIEATEIVRDAVEFGSRLFEGHAGLEASVRVEWMGGALPGFRRRREAEIGPHIESRARLKIGGFTDEREIAGEHADHGVRRIVQTDLATDDCRCGRRSISPTWNG